jgi:hypothetical protein
MDSRGEEVAEEVRGLCVQLDDPNNCRIRMRSRWGQPGKAGSLSLMMQA